MSTLQAYRNSSLGTIFGVKIAGVRIEFLESTMYDHLAEVFPNLNSMPSVCYPDLMECSTAIMDPLLMRIEVPVPPNSGQRYILLLNRHRWVYGVVDREERILWIGSYSTIRQPTELTLGKTISAVQRMFDSLCGSAKTIKSSFDTKKINMGADIEASVIDSDLKFYGATNFVPDSQVGSIGTDGNVDTLEIRPESAKTPKELTDNIEFLLRELKDSFPDGIDIVGGGGGAFRRSTGFHIHFSGTPYDFDRKSNHRDLEEVIAWLDLLLGDPISRMAGAGRADGNYGGHGDYRCKRNHAEFAHNGWEWRMPPNFAVGRQMTESILTIARCIVDTFFSGKDIEHYEKDLKKTYCQLVGYEENKELIDWFISTGQFMPLNIAILQNWFGKKFEKDHECDILVRMTNGELTGTVADWYMYNPQKKYSRICVYERPESINQVALSVPEDSIIRLLKNTYGITTVVKNPSESVQSKYGDKRTLYIGIPLQILRDHHRRTHGSRNGIRLFIQSLIRAI